MKTLLLTFAGIILGSLAFGQDLLGTRVEAIRKTTQGVKGIQVQSFGDSTLEVINKNAERYFSFKLDPTTGICYREEVQLKFSDLENRRILDQFFHLNKQDLVKKVDGISTYEAKNKRLEITQEGNVLKIAFTFINPASSLIANNDLDKNKSVSKD